MGACVEQVLALQPHRGAADLVPEPAGPIQRRRSPGVVAQEALEVGGERSEGLDGRGVPIGRDRHVMLGRATVDAGDIDLQALED